MPPRSSSPSSPASRAASADQAVGADRPVPDQGLRAARTACRPRCTTCCPTSRRQGDTPALEFLSPVKGPALEQITVEVGSGIPPAEDGAALYDQDVKKQAKQLGLAGLVTVTSPARHSARPAGGRLGMAGVPAAASPTRTATMTPPRPLRRTRTAAWPSQARAEPYAAQVDCLSLWFYVPGGVVYVVLFLVPTLLVVLLRLTRWTCSSPSSSGSTTSGSSSASPVLDQGLHNTLIYALRHLGR